MQAPQWVLDALNSISKDATIGFEDDHEEPPRMLLRGMNVDVHNNDEEGGDINEEAEEVLQLQDNSNINFIDALVNLEAIEATKESAFPDPIPIGIVEPELDNTADPGRDNTVDPNSTNEAREKTETMIDETIVPEAMAE